MSLTIRLGHRVEFFDKAGTIRKRFQNWHIDEWDDGYWFLPFGFSGVTFSRNGDNINAAIHLPVDNVSRSWSQEAIEDRWIARVEVLMFDSDDRNSSFTVLHEYSGQISASTWDMTSIRLELNSVLDAVGQEVPRRQLHQKLVGRLPTTGSIALR